jgi:heptose I phosphotransferase
MFHVHPEYRDRLAAAGIASFADAAALKPADRYVEKQGRSTGRYRLSIAGETLSLYVKKHSRLSWWRRMITAAGSFAGPNEWRNLQTAAALGVRVPESVFVGTGQTHECGSVLAVRELEGYLPLHEYVPGPLSRLPEPARHRRKRALIARLADAVRRLHRNFYYHRDLYLCHFYLRDDPTAPDGLDLVVIDFGRLLRSRLRRWQVKDLAGLLYSSGVSGVSRTDRLRFFKSYLAVERLDRRSKRLARQVLAKAERYRRHNARRGAA